MSTARAALVTTTGVVEAVIVVDLDGTYDPPAGLTAHVLPEGSSVGPGWSLDGSEFIPPPNPEPAGEPLPSILDVVQQVNDQNDLLNAIILEMLG